MTFSGTRAAGTYVQFRYTTVKGTARTVRVNYGEAGNFTYDSGKNRYQVNLNSLAAADFGQSVEIVVYDGSGQISGVYTYSVETYVHNTMEKDGFENVKPLLHAMMSYSNGAKAYFQ